MYEKHLTQARADIRAVLTPEQRAKLDEQMAKHQQLGKQG
jgi:Spy/CpxP family protein refolding chaperone